MQSIGFFLVKVGLNRHKLASPIAKQEGEKFKDCFERFIKDTFEDELADIMIRVMDLAAYKEIDLEKHIALKMRYNAMRPHKHGKLY